MKPIHITSRDNSLLRRARAVRDGKIKESIFVEGLRLCEEALVSGLKIEALIYSDEIASKERPAGVIAELEKAAHRAASVSEKLLHSISYTKTPQGIIALASRPRSDEASFAAKQPVKAFLVILHGINNPVNVGAILRTAEAAGATGAITSVTTSDPFGPKALRGAMGSSFRLSIWTNVEYPDMLAWCRQRGIKMLCADVNASAAYFDADWKGPHALIVGPESTGLTEEEIRAADDAIKVPMQPKVESLNVAVAAGIILYEAARQRRQP